NWKRSKEEVEALMVLLEDYLDNGLTKLAGRNARIRFIGDRSAFSESFQQKQKHMEEATKNNSGLLLNIALNYGSRDEIARMVKSVAADAAAGKINPDDITEEFISDRLDTAGLPDVDLIIRPSGERRLSNFLMWQCAYAELWFDSVLWPDFSKNDLLRAIIDYQNRDRRFGGR
ncbi:MAG: polyprenyl diphosphate synthase, partial [Clostridia bacterium]